MQFYYFLKVQYLFYYVTIFVGYNKEHVWKEGPIILCVISLLLQKCKFKWVKKTKKDIRDVSKDKLANMYRMCMCKKKIDNKNTIYHKYQ